MSRLILLGKNIKKYRELKGLTQETLSEKLNLSREYIVRVENGQKFLSLRKIFETADILDVKVKNLFDFN